MGAWEEFLAPVGLGLYVAASMVRGEIVAQIERSYILEVDRSELMETAVHAIIGKLDSRGSVRRTNDLEFLGANVVAQINENTEQQIGGIGAALKVDEETKEIIATRPHARSNSGCGLGGRYYRE